MPLSTIEFKVIGPRARKPKTVGPTFVLEQDNWNDYGFETQYQLYYFPGGSPNDASDNYIGAVKILRRGQTAQDSRQITADVSQLSSDFCSVGESLDYYKRLSKLGMDVRDSVLEALRDVIFNPSLEPEFGSEVGWGKSLFRDQGDQGREFRLLAGSMLSGDYTSVPADDLSFSFKLPHWNEPTAFSFKSPTVRAGFSEEAIGLPGRIAVVVGRNGSGKSTLLARLARVAFGTVGDRTGVLKDIGDIQPVGIGFPRIVNITFSPFDSFRLPVDSRAARRVVARETTEGEGRFVFIGLRDIAKEKPPQRAKADSKSSASSDPESADRLETSVLKSIDQLANEFSRFLERIEKKERGRLFDQVLNTVLFDAMFSNTDDDSELDLEDARDRFFRSSTGHKIALLMTAGLIAHIEPRSLVLIDEPETHLHPPLLAALMHALRRILEVHKAFAIVATHSPVIVQETLAQHVKVIQREGEITEIFPVRFETFGESIGLISQEVFGLSAEATDFHKSLDALIGRFADLDRIEALFQNGAMSQQARAYVMSRLASRKKE